MLNFFVQLVNTVGVPVVLVGTYKSLSIFEGNFSQMRRGTGQGDLVWDRMKPGKEWNHFVKSLWYFQYTRKFCSLENHPELIDVLYEETQGITDLAVKAYMLAQERAIETRGEMVTASLIRSVVKDKFRMLEPALKALKSKTKNALARFEDAYPQFLEQYIKESPNPLSKVSSEMPQIEGVIADAPEIITLTKKNKNADNSGLSKSISENSEVIDKRKLSLMNVESWLKKSGSSIESSESSNSSKAVLPEILNSIKNVNNKSVYAALREAGFIRSGNEFLLPGGSQL